MERSQLRIALPFAAAVATGGLIIWAILHYFKAFSSKPKGRATSKYRYPVRSFEELENAEWECVGEVSKVWIYPIKSCAGIPVKDALAERHGLELGHIRDRSLMIIDKNGNMVTGRKENSTVLITPSFNAGSNSVTLLHPHLQPLQIDLSDFEVDGRIINCRLWNANVRGIDCGDEVADWLRLAFDKPYRLVYHDRNGSSRSMDREGGFPMIRSSDSGLFSDLVGFMLMTTSSMDDLKKRAPCQVHTESLRPCILVKGPKAYDEDYWTYIKIGEAIFRNIKPCPRCSFTTIDFKTGKRDPKMEPLRTLKKYRCEEGNEDPYFGIYLGLDKGGRIAVDEKVYVLRN